MLHLPRLYLPPVFIGVMYTTSSAIRFLSRNAVVRLSACAPEIDKVGGVIFVPVRYVSPNVPHDQGSDAAKGRL